MSLTIGSRFGVFEVQSLLGVGGMGEVYLARDTRLGRDVALKVIPAAVADDRLRLERFTREARALAALTHPAIGAIYDVAEHEETRALVLELVEGDTLDQRLKRGPLSIAEALTIARAVAEALDAAHDKGLVHRDLKPGNIKLTPAGDVKVLDFGLAKMLGDEHDATTSTVDGTIPGAILGTAAYMSPEQARGQAVDKRADVWAFGCLLFEMLSGRPAFGGGTWSDSIARTLSSDPDWALLPAGMPPQVLHLVERCLQKDPKQRLRGLGSVELAFTDRAAAGRPSRRWPLALAGIVALALVAGAAWSLNGRTTPDTAADTLMRFEMPLSIRLAESGSFALSPDGQRVVMVGTGADGRFRLWERTLDSLEIRPINGSDGEIAANSTLWWSPDSRSIAFYADGAVRRIDRDGGQVHVVCRVPGVAVGGTWNTNDVMVVGSTALGLLRCPAAGGDFTPVTQTGDGPPDGAAARPLHLFPSFLPDGRHLLYFQVTRTDPTANGLYMADLSQSPAAQSKRRVIETGFRGALALNGADARLLFVRNRGVWAVRFDMDAHTTSGEPVQVIPSVGTFRDFAMFDTNGRVLVYRGGITDYQLAWRGRRGEDLGTAGEPGRFLGIALAPDASRAAVVRENTANRSDQDLWLIDLRRNATTRFSADAHPESTPTWSADGRSVLYSVGHDYADIRSRPLDGGPEQTLLRGAGMKGGSVNPLLTTMSVSADGRLLIYVLDTRTAGRSDIWMLPLRPSASPAPLIQQESDQLHPSISPDGRWLAYVSTETGTGEVLVRPLRPEGGAVAAAGAPIPVSRGGGRAPRWRADGAELFYQAASGAMMAARVTANAIEDPVQLFDAPGALADWGVAPDGQRFLLALPTDGRSLPLNVEIGWMSALAGGRQP